jgi:hypothetical protein
MNVAVLRLELLHILEVPNFILGSDAGYHHILRALTGHDDLFYPHPSQFITGRHPSIRLLTESATKMRR